MFPTSTFFIFLSEEKIAGKMDGHLEDLLIDEILEEKHEMRGASARLSRRSWREIARQRKHNNHSINRAAEEVDAAFARCEIKMGSGCDGEERETSLPPFSRSSFDSTRAGQQKSFAKEMHAPQKLDFIHPFIEEEMVASPTTTQSISTKLEDKMMELSDKAWLNKLYEDEKRKERRDLLADRRSDRILSLILADTDNSDAQLLELENQASRRKKTRTLGPYGPIDVLIAEFPPEAPPKLLKSPKSSGSVQKESIFHGTKVDEGLGPELDSDDFEIIDSDDEEEQRKMQEAKRKMEGKYAEDEDFKFYFMKRPPQLTVEIANSFRPRSIVPERDLPNLKRLRRPSLFEAKKGICLCFKTTGVPVTENGEFVNKGDAKGILEVVANYLSWLSFSMKRFEDGLEVRSRRRIEPGRDMELYLVESLGKGRIKVGVIVWVKKKDVRHAAAVLSDAALHFKIHEALRRQLPSLNDGVLLSTQSKGCEDGEDFPDVATEEFTVMSPASSAALWELSMRIEAGLEISQELVINCQHDLATRARELACTSSKFMNDQIVTQSAYERYQGRVCLWKATLFRALLSE